MAFNARPPDPQIDQHGGREKRSNAENVNGLQGRNDPVRGLDRVTERGRRQPLAQIAEKRGARHSIIRRTAAG